MIMKNDLLLFFGRFHPLLVHLPIGGLVLLAFLELVSALTHRNEAAQAGRKILGFVSAAVVASAVAGWMLAQHGGYDTQLINWHRVLGFALAAACLLTFLLSQRGPLWGYRASLAANLVLLAVVSHLGGSITHGRDFLTRYAPPSVRVLLGLADRSPQPVTACPPMQGPVFEAVIAPILERHCSACHGAEQHNAQLQRDSLESWLRGGQDGEVIKPGQAKTSPLIQRMLLPRNADGHMPPEDRPQPNAAEITLIEWWINAGAPTTAQAAMP